MNPDGAAVSIPSTVQRKRVPPPEFTFRTHSSQINTLWFSKDGQRLLSGDGEGHIGIFNLSTFRPILFRKAHKGSVLTIVEWSDRVVTHGRDNLIKSFRIPREPPSIVRSSSHATSRAEDLETEDEIDANAMAYCKMSLLELSEEECWIAVPAALKDDKVDIMHLPSKRRICRSVGEGSWPLNDKTGTVMAIEMFREGERGRVRLLIAYEDGRVGLFATESQKDWSEGRQEEGMGWDLVWSSKCHKEPIMGMTLTHARDWVWTVGADNLVVRYRIDRENASSDLVVGPSEDVDILNTRFPGQSSIGVRDDGKILAIAGWDGTVRVHSAKTFQPLAVLEYHRESVFSVAFSPTHQGGRSWIASAGKDERICLVELYPIKRSD